MKKPAKQIDIQGIINNIEDEMMQHEQVDCPLQHFFTPGLYTRQIFIPKGTHIISKIHNTAHPYIISVGKVKVFTEEEGTCILTAPHMGITKPLTRRVLIALEDTVWTTFHATDKTTVDEVEKDIMISKEEFLKLNRKELPV